MDWHHFVELGALGAMTGLWRAERDSRKRWQETAGRWEAAVQRKTVEIESKNRLIDRLVVGDWTGARAELQRWRERDVAEARRRLERDGDEPPTAA